MIKRVAASVLAMSVVGGGLTIATVVPAEAASDYQQICSSKASTLDIGVYPYNRAVYPKRDLDAGECYPYLLPKGGTMIFLGNSYRVGYGGDYSECRTNTGFTPYKGADHVYFKTYTGTHC